MDPVSTALYLLVLLISAALLYDRATRRIPSRLGADQAPKSEFGIVPVDGFASQLRASGIEQVSSRRVWRRSLIWVSCSIVFVHGLGSNPDTTWRARTATTQHDRVGQSTTNSEDRVCWVSDFLREDIPSVVRQDMRVFFYNYDSYWQRDAVQTRLWNLSNSLLHRISAVIRRSEEERNRNLIFVGHSYGGLVIKQALIQANEDRLFANIAEHTRAVFFLGTPHRGSSLSTLGSIIARALQPLGSNPAMLAEVAYDSTPLLDLHRQFVAIVRDGLQVVNFFEQRRTRVLKLWFIQWEEFCVREQSATYDGHSIQNIGLPVDHYGLNKFGSRNQNYKTIVQKLLEIIKPSIPQRPQHQYSVPLETVRSYTVRHRDSSAIEEKLRALHENSSVSYALAIHGLGGTGKTQLALKYVEDHKDKYNPILWIDAHDEETVRSSFERCVTELKLSVDRTQRQGSALADSAIVQAVVRWLRERKELDDEWLVVVDNADDVHWGIKKVIPKGTRGSIIITSQDGQSRKLIDGECEELRIDMMAPLEARALLLQHLTWRADSPPQDICEGCDMVAKRLGYLALAVDLAGAYIGNDPDQGAALKQYLTDYDKHQDELLQSDDFRGLSATDKTVWTVWDTTLEKIKSRHADGRPDLLLAFLARFKGGIIQDELFRLASLSISVIDQEVYQGTQELTNWLKRLIKADGQEWDSFYYRKAVETLVRYSLLQRADGEWPGVSIHSLVQWRATKYEQDQRWDRLYLMFTLAACREILREAARPQFRRHVVTHISDVGRCHLDDIGVNDEKKEFVWSTLSSVYYDEGRWKEAEELDMQVMETRSRVLGGEHPDTLTSMANLASTYRNQGRWKEAEELEVQVMKTSKRVLGGEHPDTLTSMANLASTYRNQGRWKEAEELGVQVMKTRSRVLGGEHPDTLTSMANLASTFWNQGRWKEAEELGVQVMETSKRVLGGEHPDTLTSMANLASTYRNQGRWKEAEELGVQVMETRSRVLGAEHPDTLTSMNNLAHTYKNLDRTDDAIELMKRATELMSKTIGPDHPNTIISMNSLKSWIGISSF